MGGQYRHAPTAYEEVAGENRRDLGARASGRRVFIPQQDEHRLIGIGVRVDRVHTEPCLPQLREGLPTCGQPSGYVVPVDVLLRLASRHWQPLRRATEPRLEGGIRASGPAYPIATYRQSPQGDEPRRVVRIPIEPTF